MITKITKGLAARRRAIANDVIAQIEAQRYVPRTGVYMCIAGLDESTRGDLQCLLKTRVTKSKPCDVCALGSAFLSTVRLFDKFKVTAHNVGDGAVDAAAMRAKLHKFFNPEELQVIEASFEQNGAHLCSNLTQRTGIDDQNLYESIACNNYRKFLRCMSAESRLLWLMRSIIASADGFINLRTLRDQALIEIATNPDLQGIARTLI